VPAGLSIVNSSVIRDLLSKYSRRAVKVRKKRSAGSRGEVGRHVAIWKNCILTDIRKPDGVS